MTQMAPAKGGNDLIKTPRKHTLGAATAVTASTPGKPILTPPFGPRPARRDPGIKRLKIAAFLAVLVLAVIAVGVVVILPGRLAPDRDRDTTLPGAPEVKKPAPDEGPAEPARSVPAAELKDPASATLPSVPGKEQTATNGPGVSAPGKAEAQRLLREALQYQARLDNSGARIWGARKLNVSYPDAVEKLADGDAFFAARQFDSAAVAYQGAIGIFQQLDAGRPERLRLALQAGTKALQRRDAPAAAGYFETGLSIEPGNRAAQRGLQRARQLPRVLDRYQKGQTFEAQGELKSASSEYQAALALDSEFQPAKEGVKRTTAAIALQDYRQALSQAISALDDKQYASSSRALAKALRLRPEAPELNDLRRRLRAAKIRAKVNNSRRQATQYVRNEQWAEAVDTYDHLLKMDKTLSFAIDGKARAQQFLELNRRIDRYLADPERLYSPDPLRNARKLLQAANGVTDAGPALAVKVAQLGTLIEAAMKPVPVVLQSDEATEVVIYRVGNFGRFKERRLRLLPGEYIAVGSRRGYRDVRIRFKVSAAQKEIFVVIRSEKLI